MDPRTDRRATELQDALDGAPSAADTANLVALAAELRAEGLHAASPQPGAASREALRRAVLASAANHRRPGLFARLRGASLVVAGVTGAGLVVASAASGSNPVVLVVDAARELPRLAAHGSPPATVSLEGQVLASRDNGQSLEVRVGEDTLTVEAPSQGRAVVSRGTPVAASEIEAGDTVRVTADRVATTDVVTAKRIEIIQPSGIASPARTAEPTRPSGLVAAEPTGQATTDGTTPTPAPTDAVKATPTSGSANDTSVATTSVTVASRTPASLVTPTPSPEPSVTATKSTVDAPYVSDSSDASSADAAGDSSRTR